MHTIINFAPTAMMPTKKMTLHVTISISEILDDVLNAHEMGITKFYAQ